MIVGEIVETLIGIKDKTEFSRDKQALEEACNILSKSFNRLESYENIINKRKDK